MNLFEIELIQYKKSEYLNKYKIIENSNSLGKLELKYQNLEGFNGWFLTISINQKNHNKGIGTIAIAQLLTLINTPVIYANVKKSNKPSIHILQKNGFEEIHQTQAKQLIYCVDFRKSSLYFQNLIDGIKWEDYYPSVYTDLCNFIAVPARKNMRISHRYKNGTTLKDDLIDWLEKESFSFTLSDDYIYISKRNEESIIKKIDNIPNHHVEELGMLLGYPSCCIDFLKDIPEDQIDTIEETLNTKRMYHGNQSLIDISSYRKGNSLLSHIPCEVSCPTSYFYALLTKSFQNKLESPIIF